MALVLKDRVRVTSSTTGTGTFTLGSAAAGFQDFSVIGDGNTTYYTIQNSGDNTWEVGIGTYTASGTTLSRDTVLESSNSGSLVNFAAGTKDVFVTYPAEKGLYLDASNNAIGLGTPASATLTNATGLPISTGVSGLGSGVATFLGTPSSSNLASAVTDETGSGSLVFATSPTLVTPALGTPSSGTLTSCTGLPLSTGVTGTLPVTNGGTGTATSFTTGSVVFAGASGVYSQNNAGFFWDNTNSRLGIGTTSPTQPLDINGNLAITGTARRITGDFSNATLANRVWFRDATTNNSSTIGVLPNGTSAVTSVIAFGGSDPDNAPRIQIRVDGASDAQLRSEKSGTGSYLPMTFYTGGSERMRIDTSGNVGIGTSSPARPLSVVTTNYLTASFISSGAETNIQIQNTATNGRNWSIVAGGNGGAFSSGQFGIYDSTAGAARLTIDSNGNVGIGTTTTSTYPLTVSRNANSTQLVAIENTNAGASATAGYRIVNNSAIYADFVIGSGASAVPKIDTSASTPLAFATAGTERMRITSGGEVYIAGTTDQGAYNLQCNGTGVWGAGAYVNGSDERIKQDITPIDTGLDVVNKLNPVTYKYKEDWSKDQSIQTGFIAQDLLVALEGKNYVDGIVQQGGEYMSVAYQNIIPLLTKAIQELSAKVEALEAQLQGK